MAAQQEASAGQQASHPQPSKRCRAESKLGGAHLSITLFCRPKDSLHRQEKRRAGGALKRSEGPLRPGAAWLFFPRLAPDQLIAGEMLPQRKEGLGCHSAAGARRRQ